MKERMTFKAPVAELGDDQVYVYFGNTVGRVESSVAYKLFGAKIGKIDGLTGKCYAICSYRFGDMTNKDRLRRDEISSRIKKLYEFALKNPKTQFLVEYTVLDAILTFYSIKDMAKMFSDFAIPKNIIFEEEFNKFIV